MPQYQHIESLIRDLHTARNIAQPENFPHSNANHPNQPVLVTTHPCPSVLSNTHHAHHRLMIHQMSPVHPPPTLGMIIDEEEFVSSDIVEVTNIKTNTNHPPDVSLRFPLNNNSNKLHKSIGNDVHCSTPPTPITPITPISPIPSVMVNDVTEPLDLISTTQRRFSQLYSGLRRLSTSNTVGLHSDECVVSIEQNSSNRSKKQIQKMMLMLMMMFSREKTNTVLSLHNKNGHLLCMPCY